MLNEAIKQSESYQMFIKYSTGQISPKKSRGKGSQRKKTDDDSQKSVDLGKSISKTKAEEAEAARQVHATHARIVIESVPDPTKRRKSGKVTSDPPKKLKGVPSLTPEEQEVADTIQALKEKQESEYLEEDQLNDEEKDDKDDDANDEGDDYISDNQDADDEDAETESDEDEVYKYKIRARKDKDVEMSNAEVEDFDKGLGRVLTPVQESPSIAIVTTIPPPSVSTTPPVPQQTTTLIPTPPITTDALIITTTVSKFDALSVIQLRVAKLEKDVSKLKKIVLFAEALAALKIQVPSVIDNYLGSKVGDVFKKN
ncbi:hypothetical protein Tco_0654015 [Tanacetum coccineum]|uniref:Uncharacterized protein n=1 Tax=Tanacetum coccineum TaxID=301880 RepID=A0ABQ4X215_9ASTR